MQLPAGRPSVVFFFAGWCGSCVPEAAALGQLQREHGQNVNIVAVDIDRTDTPDTISEFLGDERAEEDDTLLRRRVLIGREKGQVSRGQP